MNAPGSDEVLFGAGRRHLPADELLPSEIRREALRRAARPAMRRKSLASGLLAWLHL